jgi:hypothetical protein
VNKNCLKGLGCPNCGDTSAFRISARCWAEVHDDGIHDSSEFEWEDDAACICVNCSHSGTVADFNIQTQKSPSFPDIDVYHETEGRRWSLTWEWIGEGNSGDFDPEDPDDMTRLRASLRVDGLMVRNGSYCTLASIHTPRTELEASAMELLLSVSGLTKGPVLFDGEVQVEGVKNLMETWTWKEYTHGVHTQDPDE